MSEDEHINQIEDVIQPILREHGLELVDVEWRPHGPRGVLRVFVDKPGGVALIDIERASRQVGDILDVADLIEGRYDLEVSSPGLDRPLRKDREFRWALGKSVRCWLADGEDFAGRLVEVTDDRLVIDVDGETRDVARADLRRARLEADIPWRRQA